MTARCLCCRSLSTRPLLRLSYLEISNFIRARTPLKPSGGLLLKQCSRQVRELTTETRPLQGDLENALEKYKNTINFAAPTHSLFNLAESDQEGVDAVLQGYLGTRHDLSKRLSFVRLYDTKLRDSIQLVSNSSSSENAKAVHERLKSISPNSPVVVRGITKKHTPKSPPTDSPEVSMLNRPQGRPVAFRNIEVELTDVHLLNDFPKDIIVTRETVFPPRQRHLQLRTDSQARRRLAIRSQAYSLCRKAFASEMAVPDFTEVETPVLFKSTPEGAREFIVPTRQRGLAYALPQSPQQYKQILMASGIKNYFQFAKCFRDEDHRADRQPEFTQLDLEMAFATREDVMSVVERIISVLWYRLLSVTLPLIEKETKKPWEHPQPFNRMTYQDALARWGSDKPDLRYSWEISRTEDVLRTDLISKITPLSSPVVDVMKARVSDDPSVARKFVGDFMDSSASTDYNNNPHGAPGIFIFDSAKPLQGLQPFGFEAADAITERLQLQDGDIVLLQARPDEPFSGGVTMMGNLRRDLFKAAVTAGLVDPPRGWSMLWVTDFPLFSPVNENEPGQGGAAGLASTHHPFTSPKTAADVDLLLTDATKAVGDHYDLVINGVEIGGGSRRIHHHKVQEFVLKDVLKVEPERMEDFSHLLEALRAGCPPHAGFAFGFDRLMALITEQDSVRDVIAFPKMGSGEDPMVKAPAPLSEETLRTYHLNMRD